jgi:polyphosphate:AMP phosphotransferase
MFEATKLGRKVAKEDFKREELEMRTDLLAAQRELRGTNTPVIILVLGVDGAGKGDTVDRLTEWLDTRGLRTFDFWDETDEERERPRFWRFWRALPPRGEIAILFGGWYLEPFENRFCGDWSEVRFDNEMKRIADFERMLTRDGALVVKFWFHMPEKAQKKRLRKLKRNDPRLWKTLPRKGEFSKHYRSFEQLAERMIRQTDTGPTPWYLIEATDHRYRDLTVGRTLLRSIRNRLSHPAEEAGATPPSEAPSLPEEPSARITVLDKVDLGQKLEPEAYKKKLKSLKREIQDLAWKAHRAKRSTVMVFEGVDAGGKGGAIRRLTGGIDSRLYRTIPVTAPTDEEKAHHYLWRFWRHLPIDGRITIYDRSWYGRVLVERVEGFASPAEWQRAYSEINRFEEQLVRHGTIMLKFWLHISPEEQLARFKQRQETPHKQHKITDEDWRNRERWDDYLLAVNEMVVRTSTDYAPWVLVPGNDKKFARVFVLEHVCRTLKKAL